MKATAEFLAAVHKARLVIRSSLALKRRSGAWARRLNELTKQWEDIRAGLSGVDGLRLVQTLMIETGPKGTDSAG